MHNCQQLLVCSECDIPGVGGGIVEIWEGLVVTLTDRAAKQQERRSIILNVRKQRICEDSSEIQTR